MLDVAAHMLLLQRQAQFKNERPEDDSFLPLSLTIACLLRQLPAGLAPPAGILSFHQLDRLPVDVLEEKLHTLFVGESESFGNASDVTLQSLDRAFDFVRSLLLYVKTTRALLTICHQHIINQVTTKDASQALVGYVVAMLSPGLEEQIEEDEDEERADVPPRTTEAPEQSNSNLEKKDRRDVPSTAASKQRHVTDSPQTIAVDPSGIMKRAVGRDIGDGSAVLEIMQKYATDSRIQTHGIRALKGVIRHFPSRARAESNQRIASMRSLSPTNEDDGSDSEAFVPRHGEPQGATPEEMYERDVIHVVIDSMKKFPETMGLQRDALFCLLEFASQSDENIACITSVGGVVSIMDAMARLPDDEEAQIAALSILAHPKMADESIVRVNPESLRLVLSSMSRFPLSERLQGLGCLALANLSLRQDDSMREIVAKGGLDLVVAAMKRFQDVGLIQAAGSWLLSAVSSKDGTCNEMLTACLDAGGLPACEKARLRFPLDPKVQQHAVDAIRNMVRDADPGGDAPRKGGDGECALQ